MHIQTNYEPTDDIKWYINKASLLFKQNELLDDGSLVLIETGKDDRQSPRLFASNTEFIFENNTILKLANKSYSVKYRIAAVLLFFQSAVIFASTNMLFVNNSVPESGIFILIDSILYVDGEVYAKLETNEGYDGGAMTFYEWSYISSYSSNAYAHFVFNNNLAHNRGGAIFVEDLDYIERFGRTDTFCFKIVNIGTKVKFDLFNNTAKTSGNEVYGGWIDGLSYAEFNITINNRYAVSSNPLRICECMYHSSPQCKIEKELYIFTC